MGMGGRSDEELNLYLLLNSKLEKDNLLGLQLAGHAGIQLQDLTQVLAFALFCKTAKLQELGQEALAFQASPEEMHHILAHWEPTSLRGNPVFFYDALGRIGKLERVDSDRLMRLAVQMTYIFPEERAHIYPSAFLEYCEMVGGSQAGAARLSLEGHKIPVLPSEIVQSEFFMGLVDLSLKRCSLRSLPEEMAGMKNLKKLNLEANRLKKLPEFLSRMKALEQVEWNRNPIEGVPGVLGRIEQLRAMRLVLRKGRDYSGLGDCEQILRLELEIRNGALPMQDAFFRPQLVEELKIEARDWEQVLPDGFRKWKQIKKLTAQLAPEHPFPDFVCTLARLEYLKITRVGQIPDVEKAVPQPHLHTIELSHCNWESWPEAWAEFPALRELSITRGSLSSFPRAWEQSTQLESIRLSHLPIDAFPEFILQQRNLQHLKLAHLNIKLLPEAIGQLKTLTTLELIALPLHQLPESLKSMTSLTVIRLSGLKLKKQDILELSAALPGAKIYF